MRRRWFSPLLPLCNLTCSYRSQSTGGSPEDGEEEEEEEEGEKEEVCVTVMPTSRLLKATESSLTNCIHPAMVTEADLTNLRLKLYLFILFFLM